MKNSSYTAPRRRSSFDSALSASSSSVLSEISWDDEVVAKHLGMSEAALQDHLEYKKKDDTSSLSSSAATASTTEGVDTSSFSVDAESTTEKDVVATNIGTGDSSHTGITPCASQKMRPRASIRRGSIVSLTGTVLESIQECDVSSDEETTTNHQESITFAKFEPQPDDASVSFGSEGSLQFDDVFVRPGPTEGEGAKSNDPSKVIAGDDPTRSFEDDSLNIEDAAAVSREFNESSDTKISFGSTSSIKGSTSISASKSSSKSSKPDPPEAPWVASEIPRHMHGSATSLHSDKLHQQKLPKKGKAQSSSNGAFEITDVYIPQDVADSVTSSIFDVESGLTNKDLPTIPSHFTSSPTRRNVVTTSDDDKESSSKHGIQSLPQSLPREDSGGNLISEIINNVKTKLSELSTTSSNSSKKSTSSGASSVLLNIVKDVKLELANINMMMDSYRMEQRHLSEENQELLKRQEIFEKQIESLQKENSKLQSQLETSMGAIQAKENELRESRIIQTKLRIEQQETQRLLEKVSMSEHQANLTMIHMMQHKNNACTTEFYDFAPDIDKLRVGGDNGTARTEDLTQGQVDSQKSLFSSLSSGLDAEVSSGNIRQVSFNLATVDPPTRLPERGFLRRLSNMFAKDKGEEASSSDKGEHAPPSFGGGINEECPQRYSSEGDTSFLPDETPGPVSLSRLQLSRRHSNEDRPVYRLPLTPRRASLRHVYSSEDTRNVNSPSRSLDDVDQAEGTMSLNAAPHGRRLEKFDSVRSINTQNDVMDFMAGFSGNASASTLHSDLVSIREQDYGGVGSSRGSSGNSSPSSDSGSKWAGNKCA